MAVRHRRGRCGWQGSHLAIVIILLTLLLPSAVAADGREEWEHLADDTVLSAAASTDGSLVAIGSRDNKLSVYDGDGNLLWQHEGPDSIVGVDVSEDGSRIAIATADRHVRLFDAKGSMLWQYRHEFPFSDVAISADGAYVSATSIEGRDLVFLNGKGELLWDRNLAAPVEATDIYGSGQNTRPVAGARDSRVRILNVSGDVLLTIQLDDYVRSVAVSRSGARISVALNNGTVAMLDGSKGQILWSYDARREKSSDKMLSVSMSDDGSLVTAGISYGKVFVFDGEGNLTLEIRPSKEDVEAVYVSRDGNMLIYGGQSHRANVVDIVAQEAAYVTSKARTRNLTIIAAAAVIALVGGVVFSARYTTWGNRAWKVTAGPVRGLLGRVWKARVSYLMLVPIFALLLVFNYYPAFSGLWHGFTNWTPGLRAEWVGLDNYKEAFNNVYLRVGIWNAVIFVLTGFAKLFFPLLVAELIFNLRSTKTQYVLRTLFIVPLVVPGVVSILMWVNIYDPNYGMLNQTLRVLNLEHLIRVWLGDERTALSSIIFMGVPWVGAFSLLMFYGGLITIPTELFDAAKIDGANLWQRFRHLDFPLLLTPLKTLLILGFIGGVQAFGNVFLTTGGGPGHATYTPALEMYYNATRFRRMGMASAIGTLLFVIILGGTILNLKYMRGSETEYHA